MPCAYSALLIVTASGEVKLSFWSGLEGPAAKEFLCDDDMCLRKEFVNLVSSFIERQRVTPQESCIVFRDGARTVRISPLASPDGDRYALIMEADRLAGTLARAERRYGLTPRQSQVLSLVLEGASASDVAHTLVISQYTAQGYVKQLLAKTVSRNRAAMVAKVLDWKAPSASTAEAVPAYGRLETVASTRRLAG